ncbi:MAG: 5-formyltetrahydrofolate cyclo-ligase [Candidatus Peribacteraceae bacterium]|nr:5-formyltetrahydrofolate cyclo-ligase [Candidatus Peribacteraceae bacterium]
MRTIQPFSHLFMHIDEAKSKLRDSISERLSRMSDRDRGEESGSICKRLLEMIPEDSSVCVYSALRTEPDLNKFIRALWDRGDRVFYPFFEGDHFNFREANDFSELRPGKLKILEPPSSSPKADPQEIDFVIVPARAFDREMNRLGRGNGGYDYWIKKQRKVNLKTKMIGVAFECQIVNEVPVDVHDEKIDEVVTDRGPIV